MSKIDYQKLREIAEKTKIAGEAPVMPFDQRINALNDFMKHFSPDIALALLDERERNQQYIKLRDQENEDIALTVGKLRVELEGKDSKIANLTAERDALREGEMGDARHSNTRSAADIYFQLVEECEIPAGGSLVEYVDDMREKLEAAEKRIAELEAEPVSQTYKLNEPSGNSPVTPDGWISCSERMPDDGQWCVVNTEYGYYVQCWSEGQGWLGDDISIPECDVINWIPLPEPPQEVNRG
ncbi:TPA: ead/Ea22-like family protein [Escherichia coli]|nr:ead/Ea22-like family protein [Escherichia coli]HBE6462473.1 ead/Ea22-like family protein [Escherichia coli]